MIPDGESIAEKADVERRRAVSSPTEVEVFDPLSAAATLEIAGRTVCGMLRAHNTDHYLAIRFSRGLEVLFSSLAEADLPPVFEEHAYAMFVADGVGSAGTGARASRVALSALAHLASQYSKWNVRVDTDTIPAIRERIELLYRLVYDALRETRLKPPATRLSTSLTMVAVAGKDLFFANVGNSNAFLFREGALIRLTSAQRIVEPQHPDDTDVRIEHTQLTSGDRLLLCTNGLTDGLSENEIADELALRRRPEEDCRDLIDRAILGRSSDDITALVADYRV